MGTWGSQPKDNDWAWDLADAALAEAEKWLAKRWDQLARPTVPGRGKGPKRRIPKALAETWGNPAWRQADALFGRAGAVQILLERGVFVGRRVVEEAVGDLRVVLATTEYMRDWRDPKAARRSIRRILTAMEGLLGQGFYRGRGSATLKVKRRPGSKPLSVVLLSQRPFKGAKFVPSPRILAPVGWPRKDAGKRSWTGMFSSRRARGTAPSRPRAGRS